MSEDRPGAAAWRDPGCDGLRLVRPTGVVLLGGTAGQAVYSAAFRVGESRG